MDESEDDIYEGKYGRDKGMEKKREGCRKRGRVLVRIVILTFLQDDDLIKKGVFLASRLCSGKISLAIEAAQAHEIRQGNKPH
ncbi:hypothetical protein [Marinicrinis lubricantis]|uniref:Uncharacterized protein n=1 Tax=Marinicrinis lubricantis TaxID=2086470 RepID=A0ABW1IJ27_9BACL